MGRFLPLSAGYRAGAASPPINHPLHGNDTVVFYRIAHVWGFVISLATPRARVGLSG
jgi:hypothetical protein